MIGTSDLEALYHGLCYFVRQNPPPWVTRGHVWTSVIKRYLVDAAPRTCLVLLEVPTREGKNPPRLDIAWAQGWPDTTASQLDLAIEVEMQGWRANAEQWLEEMWTDFEKVLDANAPSGAFICAVERDAMQALGRLLERLPDGCQKRVLVVVLGRPQEGGGAGCVAHAVIRSPSGLQQLPPQNCWEQVPG